LAKQISVGDTAPDFTLPSQTGELVRLADLVGKKEVVLYFYPKDNTPGCTVEAQSFRDSYETFRQMGAEVIGVSSDSVNSHRDFATTCNLPFIILSDTEGKVRKLYGVPSTFGLLPGRVTYIIDTKGVVRHIFSSQMNPKKHVDEAIRVLKSIREQEAQKKPSITGNTGT
jgi:peroxiredoxin Q/BCP